MMEGSEERSMEGRGSKERGKEGKNEGKIKERGRKGGLKYILHNLKIKKCEMLSHNLF